MTTSSEPIAETSEKAPEKKPASPPPPAVAGDEVARRIGEIRERQQRVTLATGLCMGACAAVAWLVFEMTLDWEIALVWPLRALIFLVGAGGAGFVFWKLGLEPYRRPVSDDAAALMIEREMPIFRSRFIAAVQLNRAAEKGGSPGLVRALVAETAEMARTRTFAHVVKTLQLKKWAKSAAGALAFGLLLWLVGGKNSAPLLTRALLWNNPVPRKTMVSGLAGDRVAATGDDVRIEANVTGILPAHGRILVTTASGKKQEYSFEPDVPDRSHFARAITGVQESFQYNIELGDNRAGPIHVKVKPRPGILSIDCTQIFPAYTKLPPQPRPTTDLKLLAGSHLAVKVKANARLAKGLLRLTGADPQHVVKTAPFTPDPHDSTLLAGEVEIPRDAAGLNLVLTDTDGLESKGGAIYPIETVPDEPPTVTIRWPDRREELLTPGATMLLAFEAKDDFGIARIRLHYAVDWTDGAKDSVLDFDLGGTPPREVVRRFNWKIARLKPPVEEGHVIDYWLEVSDGNTATGPGVATMDHYQARIVSEQEKRADLANRLNETMQGLDEVRQGQEEASKRLGEIIFEKPVGPMPPAATPAPMPR